MCILICVYIGHSLSVWGMSADEDSPVFGLECPVKWVGHWICDETVTMTDSLSPASLASAWLSAGRVVGWAEAAAVATDGSTAAAGGLGDADDCGSACWGRLRLALFWRFLKDCMMFPAKMLTPSSSSSATKLIERIGANCPGSINDCAFKSFATCCSSSLRRALRYWRWGSLEWASSSTRLCSKMKKKIIHIIYYDGI